MNKASTLAQSEPSVNINYDKNYHAEKYSPGKGLRPSAGPTGRFKDRIRRILRERTPTAANLSEGERVVIQEVAGASGRIYSVGSLARKFERRGAPHETAYRYALSFVVRELGGSWTQDDVREWTIEEKAALGESYLGEFEQNLPEGHSFSLVTNLETLPAIQDPVFKPWFKLLAENRNLKWVLDLDGISEPRAREFLVDLLKQTDAWGYPLRPGQIEINSSFIGGFDIELLRRPNRDLRGFLSENGDSLRQIPLGRHDLFRKVFVPSPSSEKVRHQVAALLAGAIALRNQVQDFHIGPADGLATASRIDYTGLLGSLLAYAEANSKVNSAA